MSSPHSSSSGQSKIIGGLWRKLGAEEKKRYTDASKRALEKFKAEHPNLPKSQKKKKKEAQTKVKEEKEQQEREEQEEEVLQEETEDKESEDEDKDKKEYAKASKRVQEEPPNPSKSKRKKKKEKAAAREEKEGGQEEADAPTPKRPPSSYMMYSSEVRPQVMKEHPGKRMGEVVRFLCGCLSKDSRHSFPCPCLLTCVPVTSMCPPPIPPPRGTISMRAHTTLCIGQSKIIGELWGKLGAEEKKRYTDASKRALEKFKAEHPNLPKKKRKRKNEAQAKVKEEKEKEKEQEEQEEEETEDKEFKDEDVDKDKKEYAKASKRAQEEPPNPPKSKRKKKKEKAAAKEEEERGQEEGEYETKENALVGDNDNQKTDNTNEEEHGDTAVKRQTKKKKRQRKSSDAIANLPAEQAAGLEGWTIRIVPRKTVEGKSITRSDKLWFSPNESFQFRSKTEVQRFRDILENDGNGDELATMELYQKGKKDRIAAGKETSPKKHKATNNKKKKKKTISEEGFV